MKNKFMMAVVFLMSASAWAQTPATSQAQVIQTRDFVGSLINRISSGSADQFSVSADYARSGLALQRKFAQSLTQFKVVMDYIAQGPLAVSIDQYNAFVRDTSVPAAEKAIRLTSFFRSVQIQSRAAESTYQMALFQLYRVEPTWVPNEIEALAIPTTFQLRIKESLKVACQSQVCMSSMLAAYAAYFNDVAFVMDQDLKITLADGKTITLLGLTSSHSGGQCDGLRQAMSTYQFGAEYSVLPFKI